MKKNGFTLAEVLITLAIVGVVAALTLPTLTNNTVTAQIGPKLSKAVSAFEQANQALLQEFSVDALTDTGLTFTDNGTYVSNLANHFKITTIDTPEEASGAGASCDIEKLGLYPRAAKAAEGHEPAVVGVPGNSFRSKDGIVYVVARVGKVEDGEFELTDVVDGLPHNQRLGTVYVDINGTAGPNEYATDAFIFELYNDGSLRPVGGTGTESETACSWENQCKENAVPGDTRACAGHVFENNLKVRYN